MRTRSSFLPAARKDQLVVEHVQDELLVYDQKRHDASCLNVTAAQVWQYCDGKSSVDEIAARMSSDMQTPVETRTVWYALDQLSKKDLLTERAVLPVEYARLSRRDFLKAAGLVGVAVAVPVIISVAAPTPAQAASCTTSGGACGIGSECCTGVCNSNICT